MGDHSDNGNAEAIEPDLISRGTGDAKLCPRGLKRPRKTEKESGTRVDVDQKDDFIG